MAERPVDRDGGVSAVIAAAIGLPLLYVLSIGPVAAVANKLGVDKDPLQTFYRPVIWLHDHTPLKRPLEAYLGLWGVR